MMARATPTMSNLRPSALTSTSASTSPTSESHQQRRQQQELHVQFEQDKLEHEIQNIESRIRNLKQRAQNVLVSSPSTGEHKEAEEETGPTVTATITSSTGLVSDVTTSAIGGRVGRDVRFTFWDPVLYGRRHHDVPPQGNDTVNPNNNSNSMAKFSCGHRGRWLCVGQTVNNVQTFLVLDEETKETVYCPSHLVRSVDSSHDVLLESFSTLGFSKGKKPATRSASGLPANAILGLEVVGNMPFDEASEDLLSQQQEGEQQPTLQKTTVQQPKVTHKPKQQQHQVELPDAAQKHTVHEGLQTAPLPMKSQHEQQERPVGSTIPVKDTKTEEAIVSGAQPGNQIDDPKEETKSEQPDNGYPPPLPDEIEVPYEMAVAYRPVTWAKAVHPVFEAIPKLLLDDIQQDDPMSVEHALKQLVKECGKSEEQRELIFRLGGHTVAVLLMRKWLGTQSIQELGCRLMRNLTMHGSYVKDFTAMVGGMESLVNAMGNFPDASVVQKHGFGALANLFAVRSETMVQTAQRFVRELNGSQLIMLGMRRFPEDEKIQEYGCFALYKLGKYYDLKEEICLAGGLSTAATAYEHHRDRDRVNTIKLMKFLFD